MNDVMKFLVSSRLKRTLMKSKSLLLLLNKFVHGLMAKLKSLKPLTIVPLSRSATVCSAPAFSVR